MPQPLKLWLLLALGGMAAGAGDLAVAIISSDMRHALVEASRCWRCPTANSCLPTVIATNSSADAAAQQKTQGAKDHNEFWITMPDEVRKDKDGRAQRMHAKRPGDLRAAMLPALAHAELAHRGLAYKFMLYADDDTVFYLHPLRKLLEGLDPNSPLAMTDNVWLHQRHPHLGAPRCTPCKAGPPRAARLLLASGESQGKPHPPLDVNQDEDKNISTAKALPTPEQLSWYRPLPGCGASGCTPEIACRPYVDRGVRCRFSGAHGGAGIVFSVGLMLKMKSELLQKCLSKQYGCAGGDCLLSRCLWQTFNVAFTDPGYSVEHNSTRHVVFDNVHFRIMMRDPMRKLGMGECNGFCKWQLRNGISSHIGARSLTSIKTATELVTSMCASHALAWERLATDPVEQIADVPANKKYPWMGWKWFQKNQLE